jgi:hypothetical protein
MSTDKFALSSSGWPFNQLARQPVPPQRMGKGGSFPGRHSLGGGDNNSRSLIIWVWLWLNAQSGSVKLGQTGAFGKNILKIYATCLQ